MSRILVVDDCPDTVATFSRLLRLWGHDVLAASNGRSALSLAASSPPDAALVDLRMPGIDGVEVARRLRRMAGNRRTLILAVTGSIGRAGCDAPEGTFDLLLRKPVDPDALRRLLAALLDPPRPAPAPRPRVPLPASDSSWQMICVGG
jgi:CheY-like chemotaxis protein